MNVHSRVTLRDILLAHTPAPPPPLPPTPPPSPSPLTYRSLGRNLARRRLRPRQEPCSGGTWCRSPTRGILLELSTVTVCPLCGACRSDPKHHGVRYIALWHRRSSEVLSEREPECECSRRHAVSLTRTICLLSVEPAAQVQSIMVLDKLSGVVGSPKLYLNVNLNVNARSGCFSDTDDLPPLCGACRSDPKHHGARYI